MALDYNQVTIMGTSGPNEVWATGCAFNTNFGTGPVKTFEDLQAWAEAIADLDGATYSALRDLLSPSGSLTKIKVSYIDSAGITAQLAEADVEGSKWVSTAQLRCPQQVACVLSLSTGRPGRSYRGRMFWPAWGATMSASFYLSTPTPAEVAEDAAAYLTAIGAAAGVEFAMIPMVNSVKLGTTTEVTAVRVGRILDTQRRRRNAAVEVYSSSPVPPA